MHAWCIHSLAGPASGKSGPRQFQDMEVVCLAPDWSVSIGYRIYNNADITIPCVSLDIKRKFISAVKPASASKRSENNELKAAEGMLSDRALLSRRRALFATRFLQACLPQRNGWRGRSLCSSLLNIDQRLKVQGKRLKDQPCSQRSLVHHSYPISPSLLKLQQPLLSFLPNNRYFSRRFWITV